MLLKAIATLSIDHHGLVSFSLKDATPGLELLETYAVVFFLLTSTFIRLTKQNKANLELLMILAVGVLGWNMSGSDES